MNRLWKWLRSFFLREWTFKDYPVRLRRRTRPGRPGLSPPPPWTAQLEGWWQMAGFGQDHQQALEDLAARFRDHCLRGRPLHRPGAEVPITLGTYLDQALEREEAQDRRSTG